MSAPISPFGWPASVPVNGREAIGVPFGDEPSLTESERFQATIGDELADALGTDTEAASRLVNGQVHSLGRDTVVVAPMAPVTKPIVRQLRLIEGVDLRVVVMNLTKVTNQLLRHRLTGRLGRFHDISIAHPKGFVKSHLEAEPQVWA